MKSGIIQPTAFCEKGSFLCAGTDALILSDQMEKIRQNRIFCIRKKQRYKNQDDKNGGKMNLLNLRKVAMVGCGFVGAASAFAIMQSGLFSEMVLIDANIQRRKGKRSI